MQRIVYIILFVGLFQSLKGQERDDFFYFDSLTYKQYTDGSWKELTKTGMKAISIGYDYYYMRMRVGISHYERKNYLLALSHFKKALEFNNGDQIATEYIYYCYLFSGKYYSSNAVTKLFRPPLVEKTGIDKINQNRIAVDFLYNKSGSGDIINEYLSINEIPDPGNLVIPVSYSYVGVSMYHDVSPGINIKHSLSYLSRVNSFFTNDGSVAYSDYRQKVNQVQYFFSAIFSGTNGLSFTPSVFYLNTRYPLLDFNTTGMQAYAYAYPVTENNVGAGLDLRLSEGILDLNADAFVSHIGFRNHYQAGASFLLFPLANNSLYLGAGFNIKASEEEGAYHKGSVIEAIAGISANNKFYIDFSMLAGEIENFIESSGQIVYNGINQIDRIYKADISFPAGKTGLIFYMGTRYTIERTAFIPVDYLYSTLSEKKFNSLSFIGGLSWTF